MTTDLRMDQSVIPFLRAFDAVASCLRSTKQLALDVESRGDTHVEISVDRMWNASHEATLGEAQAVVVPASARACAAGLLKRLSIWKSLARQARETKEPEVELKDVATEFHVKEIWDAKDESALAAWESLRARMIGARELPFMEEAI
jgi:hypothetical protein